jgi:hypothetical protein
MTNECADAADSGAALAVWAEAPAAVVASTAAERRFVGVRLNVTSCRHHREGGIRRAGPASLRLATVAMVRCSAGPATAIKFC